MEMEKILEVNNLKVSFHTYAGEIRAVRGVSFFLNTGETLALVGESGCGKTVTAKAIMRMLSRTPAEIKAGSEVLFNQKDILKMDKKRLNALRGSDISMIFQDPMTSLNPTMTIGNQIIESLIIHKKLSKKEALKEAVKLLETVEIPNPAERISSYPHQLSGGMRQRVMVAIALACNPKVLIADEPTTALDVTIQAQILDLLRELKDKFKTAIILVTHDLGVVADFADRIQVMYAGQIVERGTKQEIFNNCQHPYTWALMSSIPRVEIKSKQELYSLKGTPPDLLLPLEGCAFASRCEYCMPICKEAAPEETVISDTHRTACWLKHPNAPKVEKPFILRGGQNE
jgi:oligopeptide transport system ATP-binding protein